jgi:nitrite reductase/ring-hydroxylating ferredoxin subunit
MGARSGGQALSHQVTGAVPGRSAYPLYDEAALGLPNFWHPVAFSRRIGRKPRAVEVCGETVVLVRSEDGRVYGLLDRCPHRGIPLSMGRREFPGTLTCVYHGWTYDLATGRLLAALTDGPDSPICRSRGVAVRTFPVEERAGLVWVYPAEGEAPPIGPHVPPEFEAEDGVLAGRITEQVGDWRHAAEAGFDEGHAKYLHRRTLWKLFRFLPAWSSIEVQRSEDGRWLSRRVTRRVYQDDYPDVGRWPRRKPFWKVLEGEGKKSAARVSIRLPGVLRVDFRGPVLGNYTAWEFWVPTRLGRYRYLQFLTAQGGLPKRAMVRSWYWGYMRWGYHVRFNDQDTEVIRNMRTPPERLYRPDQSIVEWRRMCEEALAH